MFSFGFVDFDTIEQATECQKEFNGQMLDGRQVTVDFAKPHGEGGRNSATVGRGSFGGNSSPPSLKLMVRGLPYSTTKDKLKDVFSSSDRVNIATHKDTGDSRGYVFLWICWSCVG